MATTVEKPPIYNLYLTDGLPIEEQATWILPVIRDASRAPKQPAQEEQAHGHLALVRNLVKSSGIYALASLTSPLVLLILAPFLTHHLSHTEYGALAVLTTAISLLAGITQLGLAPAFFRAYSCDYEASRDRLDVLSTVVMLLSLVTLPTVGLIILFAPQLAILLFNAPMLTTPIRIAAVVMLLQNLTLPGFSWLRAESRALTFSILTIANLLVILGANILFVGFLRLGIAGSLLASGSGYALVALSTAPGILVRAGLYLRRDIALGLLAFGVPNMANFVSVWVLQLSDRYLLSRLGSLSQTASYAVAYNLGGVLSPVIIAPFSLALPVTMFAIAKRKDAAQVFRLVFRWFGLLLLLAAFGLSLVGIATLNLLFPPAYHVAGSIIPIIALSMTFYGVYIVLTVGVGITGKTWLAVIFTTVSALVNLSLNFILIPLYGSMGAALSTLFAYIALALVAYLVNQRIYPIPFEIGLFLMALVIGIALYLGSDVLALTQSAFGADAIYLCAFLLYGGCMALLVKLPTLVIAKTFKKFMEVNRNEDARPH